MSEKYCLTYMAVRAIIGMGRVLKEGGRLYLHYEPATLHYFKPLLDTVFGHKMFSSQILWRRTSAHNDNVQKYVGLFHGFLYIKLRCFPPGKSKRF